MAAPRVTEVKVGTSVGGKICLENYVQWQDYGYYGSRTYAVDMTEEEAAAFQRDKTIDLRTELEPLADAEYEHLMEAREKISNQGNNTDV